MVNEEILSLQDFEKKIKEKKINVFDFYAVWCGPCKAMENIYELASDKLSGKCSFYKVNVDRCEDISKNQRINFVPTFAVFYNNTELGRMSGFLEEDKFLEFLNTNIERIEKSKEWLKHIYELV